MFLMQYLSRRTIIRSAMKKNMGGLDRVTRIVIALLIVILASTKVITGLLSIVLLVIAAIFVVTSLVSFCPLYTFFKMDTCQNKDKKKK